MKKIGNSVSVCLAVMAIVCVCCAPMVPKQFPGGSTLVATNGPCALDNLDDQKNGTYTDSTGMCWCNQATIANVVYGFSCSSPTAVCSLGTCVSSCTAPLAAAFGGAAVTNPNTFTGAGNNSVYCVNTSNDVNNCGSVGAKCGAGQTCNSSACACPSGQAFCLNAQNQAVCVNEQTDPNNCGACGTKCVAPQTCNAGTCACPSGQTSCSNSCVNTQTDPNNCGSCGNACLGSTPTCTAGVCATPVYNTCSSCGSSGNSCASGEACVLDTKWECLRIPELPATCAGSTQTNCKCQ